jgi:hypothetical protein
MAHRLVFPGFLARLDVICKLRAVKYAQIIKKLLPCPDLAEKISVFEGFAMRLVSLAL